MTVLPATDRPLIITRDETLLDELLRLTAAAGTPPEVAHDAGAGLRGWQRAPLVLLGADLAADVARLAPVRRDAVHLVARGVVSEPDLRCGLNVGVESVAELPAAADWVVDTLTDLGDGGQRGGAVIGVAAGSGGAGATTFACALAQLAAGAAPGVLVDADPLGAGAATVLGLDEADGARWDSLAQTTGRLGARALREGLPRRGPLGVLGWPPGPLGFEVPVPAGRETLAAARRGHATVVVDLGRLVDPLSQALAERCDHLLLVVLPTQAGVAAAARALPRLPAVRRVWLVVRGRCLDPEQVGRQVGAPVGVAMADQRGLAEALELGAGPLRSRRGPLARAAREALVLVAGDRAAG